MKTTGKAFLATLPVMAGYIVLGVGFGFLLKNNGYGFLYALAAGVLIYAGSMQYLLVGLLSGGASCSPWRCPRWRSTPVTCFTGFR